MSKTIHKYLYSSAQYTLYVKFHANGGDSVPDDFSKKTNTDDSSVTVRATLPLDVPTRDGYTFLGYSATESGPVQYQPGDSVSYTFSRNATLDDIEIKYNQLFDEYIITAKYITEPQSATAHRYAQWDISADKPIITTPPSDINTYIGGSAVLSVVATATGVITYQWQTSTDGGTTWSDIPSATSDQYSAPTSSVSSYNYRVIVTNTVGTSITKSISDSVVVTVSDVSTPVFITQPESKTYPFGVAADQLSAIATSNAPITYQWYSSSNGSNWQEITGETGEGYTPVTTTSGIRFYKSIATASGGDQTKTAESVSATITVYEATTPVFLYDLSEINETYNATGYINPLNGTATATGAITYQWQRSADGGLNWNDISNATLPTLVPISRFPGESKYRVIATATAGTSVKTATSGIATITIINAVLSPDTKWTQYLSALNRPFVKLARLDFLNPNGSIAFSLDNNYRNKRSGAFIQSGNLSVNMQNGQRRTATVTLANLNGDFDYSVNKLWFGQQVRLWEGLVLPNGDDFYISQGVFYVKDPEETFNPNMKQTTLNLVDKWAYLDGTLFGNLDGTYEVPLNSNIFNVIQSILNIDRGNGQKIDSATPVFTSFYNGKTTTLPDGSVAPLTNTPYTYRCDSENGTYADIILEMNTMLAGWIGYDPFGQLRLSPSQDDILDQTKPVQWEFTPLNSTFLGATYSIKNSEVYNDIIIIGESLSEYGQTAGRATNYDPKSDTNASLIGLKTKRYSQSGYYTQDICESLAVFKLKRESVLKKSVSISCSQMFHLQENNLVTIQRIDKPGAPVERHLITGFSRPIAQTGAMTINAVSVQDYPVATITTAT